MKPSTEPVSVDDLHLGDYQRVTLVQLLRSTKDIEALASTIETSDAARLPDLPEGAKPYGPADSVPRAKIISRIDDELAAALDDALAALDQAWGVVESARKRDVYGVRMRASSLAAQSARVSQRAARVDVLRDQLYQDGDTDTE
jgi:hypothetical protein